LKHFYDKIDKIKNFAILSAVEMKVQTNKQLMERKREPVTKWCLCDWPL